MEKENESVNRRGALKVMGIGLAGFAFFLWERNHPTNAPAQEPNPTGTPTPYLDDNNQIESESVIRSFEETLPPSDRSARDVLLSTVDMSLNDRHPSRSVSELSKKNILLYLNWLAGKIRNLSDIQWENITAPQNYEFILQPGQIFAFHDQILPDIARQSELPIITVQGGFGANRGYLENGVFGGGVCDLASMIFWSANLAHLNALIPPTRHSLFIPTTTNYPSPVEAIPGIPQEFKVSIWYEQGNGIQNLYIPNTYNKPIKFFFSYDESGTLNLKIWQIGSN